MAQVSSFYQESEVTVGTAKYKLSAPLNTIYNTDDEIDLSIAQSAWNKQQYFGISPRNSSTEAYNKRIPVTSVTSFTPTVQYKSSSAPGSANFYNVAYNPKVGTEQISMYPCIVSGTSNCFIGTQYLPDVDPYKTTSDIKVFTDFKYNEILFIAPTVKGWKKSEFSFDNMYSSGNNLNYETIPWDDFIKAPEDYYISADVMPNGAWIWNGSKYVSSSASTINLIRPAYIINSKWLKSFQMREFLPNGCEFYVDNFKAGDLPAVPQVNVNQYRDGLTTKMPWGLTTNNSVAASIFNYSFIDYTGLETNWNFDGMPNPRDIETGTYEGEYFTSEEFEGIGYKARARNVGKATRTRDDRYGYVSFRTYFDIVYEGQLFYDLLSGFGMYFITTTSSIDINAYTPDTIQSAPFAYLGEMDANGYTTCRFIQGEELEKYEGWNGKGGYVNNGFDPGKKPGGDDENNITPQEFGTGTAIGGFVRYYHLTASELNALWQKINNDSPTGFSFDRYFVSLYGLCTTGQTFFNQSSPLQIVFRIDKDVSFETGISVPYVSSQKTAITLGKIDIPRPTETFLDFAPYSSIELFIPICGWVKIPNCAVGRSVRVQLIFDISTCSCKGIVEMDGMPIAEKSGVIGSSVPFTNINSGLKDSATVQSLTQVATSALGTAVGGIAGNPVMAGMGAIATLGSLSQLVTTANKDFVSVDGGTGDRTQFGDGNSLYLKYIYPKKAIPSDYGKTVGYVVNKAMTVSAGMGFTVISDPRINASCTDTERDELRRLLEKGVIF